MTPLRGPTGTRSRSSPPPPPSSASSSSPACSTGWTSARAERSTRRLVEHEDLERARRIEHDLAVVPDHLAPGEVLHRGDRGLRNGLLERQPVAAHEVALAVGEQRLLVARQPAFHD